MFAGVGISEVTSVPLINFLSVGFMTCVGGLGEPPDTVTHGHCILGYSDAPVTLS